MAEHHVPDTRYREELDVDLIQLDILNLTELFKDIFQHFLIDILPEILEENVSIADVALSRTHSISFSLSPRDVNRFAGIQGVTTADRRTERLDGSFCFLVGIEGNEPIGRFPCDIDLDEHADDPAELLEHLSERVFHLLLQVGNGCLLEVIERVPEILDVDVASLILSISLTFLDELLHAHFRLLERQLALLLILSKHLLGILLLPELHPSVAPALLVLVVGELNTYNWSPL